MPKRKEFGKLRDTVPVISEARMLPTGYNNLNFLKYQNAIKTGPGDIAGDIEMARNLRVEEYYGINGSISKESHRA
jgi:hypothetical protein